MNLGRNFGFRVSPLPDHRAGRYVNGASSIPIGAPVKVTATAEDPQGRLPVVLATGETVPRTGINGIVIYEHTWEAFYGDDPVLTTYADKGEIPASKAIQLVSGTEVKVVLTNTVARTFLTQRDYPGRIMVAGLGATPTLAVGDFLTPGDGDDTNGYWAGTSDETKAWFVVTAVHASAGYVEARMLF